jgi:hypothetical protein
LAPITVGASSDVRLPLEDVLNANPAWLRSDLGDVRTLAASIRKHGMIQPVLLAPDFQVIDGARRVVAAQKLGWTTVPVRVTGEWPLIKAHMEHTRTLEAEGWPHEPMSLIDSYTVLEHALRDLYKNFRIGRMVGHRKAGTRSAKPDNKWLSQFEDDLGKMLGIRAVQLRPIRTVFSLQKRLGRIDKEMGDHAMETIRLVERHGGRIHSLEAYLRDLMDGRDSHRRLFPAELKVNWSPWNFSGPVGSDPKVAAEQTRRIEAIIEQQGHLGAIIKDLQQEGLNQAISLEEASLLLGHARTAQRSTGRLRTLLEAYVATFEEGESKE